MSQRTTAKLLAVLSLLLLVGGVYAHGQAQSEELVRRAKSRIQPAYPDLARKMNIAGTVKIEVVVAPSGVVKEARILGGHPVLANAALEAARKWRFEPSPTESTGVLDFKFEPR